MKIYLGGSFSAKDRIRKESNTLKGMGHIVLSRWFDPNDFIEKAWDQDMGGRVAEAMAMGDTYAILEADVVIIDAIDKSSTGGSDSELGMGIMKAQLTGRPRMIHIGPYRNIFQTLAREHYQDWEEFYDESGL